MDTATARLIDVPTDDGTTRYEALGYLEAYDAVNDDDYAFVAWRETECGSGQWRVRIRARSMAGAVLEPDAIRKNARATAARGQPYFTWGAGLEPSAGDPRQIEFRVHVADGRPAEVEIFAVLRRFDHSAAQPQAVRFAWPV